MGSSIDLATIGIQISREDADFQRGTVADLLSRRKRLEFPGAQPVSFARPHLQELRERDYFMCEKTDGIRCLLYLTEFFDDQSGDKMEAQFLVDRKNEYYYIPRDTLHLPTPGDFANHHVGTLLDGELVWQRLASGQSRLKYLIFDCLAIDNEDVRNRPFDKRLARIDSLIWNPYREFAKRYADDVEKQPFAIEMKKMEFPYGMEMMFRDRIPNLPHGNDGLIFTCKETPYKEGTDPHILKWKPPEENTIDFRLILGDFPMLEDEDGSYEDWDAKPSFELHVNYGRDAGKGNPPFAPLEVSDREWEAMKRMKQQFDGRIIECFRERGTGHWRPKIETDGTPRFRDDKTDANHISTVKSVIESIKDAVSEQDLILEAVRIRDAFKKRQKARDEEAKRAAEEEKRRRSEAAKAQQDARSKMERKESKVEDGDGPTYDD